MNVESSSPDFEREKRQTEVQLRRKEISIKEAEQSRLAEEAKRSRWGNPLFIALVGATIAAIGNIAVSWWNGRGSEQTESLKGESARIIEVLHTADVKKVGLRSPAGRPPSRWPTRSARREQTISIHPWCETRGHGAHPFRAGDRGFESRSLQRGVCEPSERRCLNTAITSSRRGFGRCGWETSHPHWLLKRSCGMPAAAKTYRRVGALAPGSS